DGARGMRLARVCLHLCTRIVANSCGSARSRPPARIARSRGRSRKESFMRALPSSSPEIPDELITGLSCPECFGVLPVRTEGNCGVLHFRCRIGHAYAVGEVIGGKERAIETHMWAAVTALDELATLLRELVGTRRAGAHAAVYQERAERALRQVE